MCRVSLLFVLTTLVPHALMGQESAKRQEDKRAIRQCIATYVEAFDQGDAKKLASCWSETGVWVSPQGVRISGRAAIESELQGYFAESRGQSLSVAGTTIRFLAATVAVEEGRARVSQAGEAPEESTYIAIHVKKDGRWKLDSVRETAIERPATNYQYLKPLEWMIGTWIDEDGESILETSCEWTKNKNFLVRSFKVRIKDRIELEGTQIVGYDAVNQKIRSWVFDTDGGISDGTWHSDGKRWIVKSAHRLATGQLGSSLNIITPLDANRFIWQSTGREMDGEILPDVEPVTVIRK